MFFNFFNPNKDINQIFKYLLKPPTAVAKVAGQGISGSVKFYQTPFGVVVLTEISGLPQTETNIFAFHIHEVGECKGDFSSAKGHYNPHNNNHPNHAGDLPPLFSNNGYALSAVLTERFNVDEIINRSVVIHEKPDDFTSQPSGNSGKRIACGVIKRN